MTDWLNRRTIWQFFLLWIICTSVGGLLGAGAIEWIVKGHANVRLLITFGLVLPVVTAIVPTLKHRSDQAAASHTSRPREVTTNTDQTAQLTPDRRAISGPLTAVRSGPSRSLTAPLHGRSAHVDGRDCSASQADSTGSNLRAVQRPGQRCYRAGTAMVRAGEGRVGVAA